MRWIFGKVFLVGLALPFIVAASAAAADTMSSDAQQIKVTATVAPMLSIIMNRAGQVEQIVSNNSLPNVVPTVYVDSVAAGNQTALTPAITKQVDALLKGKVMQAGVLYERPRADTILRVSALRPLAPLLVLATNLPLM